MRENFATDIGVKAGRGEGGECERAAKSYFEKRAPK